MKEEEERIRNDEIKWDIKVKNLVKQYGTKMAVNNISFGLQPGSIMGFLGTNGAGKSTTFKVLSGEIFPTEGSVFIKDLEMPNKIMSVRKYMGYCSQTDPILKKLTAEEHLYLYAELKGIIPK